MESEERAPLMMPVAEPEDTDADDILWANNNAAAETFPQTPVPTIDTLLKNRTLLLKTLFAAGLLGSNIGMFATTPIYATVMTNVSDIYALLVVCGFFYPILLAAAWLGQ